MAGFVLILRMIPGGVLLYSGLLHAWQPFLFAHHVSSYRILPQPLIGLAMLVVPYLQIALGTSLIAGWFTPQAYVATALLFATFVAVQAKVLLLGEKIPCGCFGFTSQPVTWLTASIPFALLLGVVTSFILERLQNRTSASWSAVADGPSRSDTSMRKSFGSGSSSN